MVELWFKRGYSIRSLVYPWFNFLLICIFQFSFSSRCRPRYVTESSLLFQLISLLFIWSRVGFMYFLSVNIFASLLVGFSASFHFENQMVHQGRFVGLLLKIQEFGFALLLPCRLRTWLGGSVVVLVYRDNRYWINMVLARIPVELQPLPYVFVIYLFLFWRESCDLL